MFHFCVYHTIKGRHSCRDYILKNVLLLFSLSLAMRYHTFTQSLEEHFSSHLRFATWSMTRYPTIQNDIPLTRSLTHLFFSIMIICIADMLFQLKIARKFGTSSSTYIFPISDGCSTTSPFLLEFLQKYHYLIHSCIQYSYRSVHSSWYIDYTCSMLLRVVDR